MKNSNHQVPAYFVSPNHPVTINLIGCGGTGSQLLTKLAQVDHALKALGHTGLHVRAFDDDDVSEANIGRQGFFPTDIGHNKAVLLITRINRAFGLNWESWPIRFNTSVVKADQHKANILITCVDSGEARLKIAKFVGKRKSQSSQGAGNFNAVNDDQKQYYWLDLGNSKDTGQVILGTLQPIKQPKKGMVKTMPTVVEMYPDLDKYDDDNEPSCSVMESLNSQDLCINSMMAEWGKKIIWDLFRKIRIKHRGVFVNLDTMNVTPIPC